MRALIGLFQLFFGRPRHRGKRREPRLRVLPLHRIRFSRPLAGEDVQIPIGNISPQGIGLIWFGEFLRSGARIEGDLAIGEKTFPIALEVRHRSTELLGCRFNAPPKELGDEIRSYLKVELEAIKFEKSPDTKVKKDDRGVAHQYSGGGQSQIYFVTSGDRIVYFNFAFLGLYIDGTSAENIRTARITGIDQAAAGSNLSHWLDIDEAVSQETLMSAWRLIESADNISGHEKTLLQDLFEPRLAGILDR